MVCGQITGLLTRSSTFTSVSATAIQKRRRPFLNSVTTAISVLTVWYSETVWLVTVQTKDLHYGSPPFSSWSLSCNLVLSWPVWVLFKRVWRDGQMRSLGFLTMRMVAAHETLKLQIGMVNSGRLSQMAITRTDKRKVHGRWSVETLGWQNGSWATTSREQCCYSRVDWLEAMLPTDQVAKMIILRFLRSTWCYNTVISWYADRVTRCDVPTAMHPVLNCTVPSSWLLDDYKCTLSMKIGEYFFEGLVRSKNEVGPLYLQFAIPV